MSFIVNPRSRGGKTGKNWPEIFEQLKNGLSNEFEVTYQMADGIGTGVAQTQQAIENGNRLIIAVGGEGTANEVLNGILKSDVGTEVKLGFVRSGTVNDYLKAVSWPQTLEEQIELIRRQNYVSTPVLKVTGEEMKYGLNVADLGVGAKIAYMASVERRLTWIRSVVRYQLLSLRAVMGWKNIPASIDIDGEVHEGDLSLLTSGFVPYSGGYNLHPHAEPYGDKMAYTMAMNFSRLDMIKKMKMLERGDHTPEMENIYMGHANHIEIKSEQAILFEVDGEPFVEPAHHITIEGCPRSIDVLKA